MIKVVSVFGTARAKPGDKNFVIAEKLGMLLAGAGFAIANGGYGGTMLAASKGAREAGGEVIGVTCSAFKAGSANKFLCREIVTTSLNERLDTLISLGSAYVVLPGGTGTLLELALVWELKNKGFLTGDKPIILLGEYWRPLVKLVATDDKDAAKFLLIAENAEKVIGLLKSRNQHC
ncbi:MAG: LOG family protein [Sedimentisphaerales bacterium]|jgi:uncharacterized protein (TIGR00730 family)